MATGSGNEEGRKKATNMYKIVVALMGTVSSGLLACGILAATSYPNSGSWGPPYFIGGFSAGILGIAYTCVCINILQKLPNSGTNDIKKREVACAMIGQYVLSMIMLMGCFLGMIFAGIGGLRSPAYGEDDRDPTVKLIVICILLGCLLAMAVTICGMCTVCLYGKYFGVVIENTRRRQVLVVHPNAGVHSTTYATSFAASGNQIQNMEAQNRLLQQQIQLQQQLQLQQQMLNQQQQQSTNPVFRPPPPSYNTLA